MPITRVSLVRAKRAVAAAAVATGLWLMATSWPLDAQGVAVRVPVATLLPAAALSLPGTADSNSPAVWDIVAGRRTLFVLTSVNGWPTRHTGSTLTALLDRAPIRFDTGAPPHGVWMEAIIPDEDGTWYGYYHNELPAELCDDLRRTLPRIGAARSRDFGETWEDLGVILEAPRGWHDCDTANRYFVGGVGDFSVVRDHDARDLFIYFSQYADRDATQGVAVARLAWADRDRPAGRVSVWWRGASWIPTRRIRVEEHGIGYSYPAGTPIYPAADGWHDDRTVDAFWGPSVHWNSHLEKYVMLLNRARDSEWRQEGVYVAYADRLDDPTAWSAPQRLIAGGMWYPQVIGLEPGSGSDRSAGEYARFFMNGRSHYLIRFEK